ncbi:hypothetical protein JMN32_26645 [Fulvivirga sp. 29W222]|uniref:UbiA prenyltransferase family protein n=1 Tax=Fulvivirga marina TaxID=2494733 RepID=A0A937G175_9BACT|nr:hypothetical protein [Fulvivirga marina]MBL6449920.1 hypothetical protein [Fulvivirga marina]
MLYRYLNILSLDVVAGACICAMFLADFLQADLHWAAVTLLGACVWLIYTFDHLTDARSISHIASTERHRFHQQHFTRLSIACVLMLIVSAFLLFMIPPQTLVWGAALSSLVLGYFLLLYLLKLKSSYHKEITIAILYATGILLPALSISSDYSLWIVSMVFIQFVMLAFTNLVVFAVYEVDSDERDSSPSIVRILGVHRTNILLRVIVIFQALLCFILLNVDHLHALELVMMTMIALLGSIVFFRRFYYRATLYRIVGDAVFLLPLLTL